MKKLLLNFALLGSALAFGQQFGIKAGVNVSSNSFDANMINALISVGAGQNSSALGVSTEKKARVGFHAGIFYNMPLASNFNIQPELLYSTYGTKFDISYLGQSVPLDLNIDYLTLPVMFQYKFVPQFYLEAGPEFGLLLSSKFKGAGQSFDTKEGMKKFNAGIGVGAGYYFTDNVGLSLRYVAGLTNIDDSGVKAKNNVFQAGLNYKF